MTQPEATILQALRDQPTGPHPGLPAAVQVVAGGVEVHGWGGGNPLHPGAAGALLSAAAVLSLVEEGLLSPGTTVRECVPLAHIPDGVDCSTGVDALLASVGRALGAGTAPVVAATLLERIAIAAGGQPLDELAQRVLVQPDDLDGTHVLPADGWQPATWCTTSRDLARLAAGPRWQALVEAGAVPAAAGGGRFGVSGGAGRGMAVWGYPAAGVGVAGSGPATALLAAVDSALGAGPRPGPAARPVGSGQDA